MRMIALALALAAASGAQAGTRYVHAGRLIDTEHGKVLADQRIDITDDRVTAVGPWSPPPTGASVTDWSALTVLPGLIDCHTHVSDGYADSSDPAEALHHSAAATILKGARRARETLDAGFTTIRDVGVFRGLSDVALRDAIAAGDVTGPRMIVAGAYITIPNGGGAVTGAAPDVPVPADMRLGYVRNADDARNAVDMLFSRGADFIKMIATGAVLAVGSTPGALELTPEEMKAACDAAKRHGSYCIAHAHGAEGIKAAIRAGARSIEHASLIDDEGLRMAKDAGVWLDMDIYDGDWIDAEGTKNGWPAEYLQKNRDTTEAQRQGFAKAVKLGVKLSFGTDAGVYPHGLNARQFAYMVRYGMTPMQAIQSATTVSAALLGKSADVGSLSPGHYADMVAVAGDPLADVRVLEKVAHVMKGGELVR
ncbi:MULTISPECIES: amidohydrolase family protein [unclassified Sphingomonas]|uniref:Xaa-Pro dipeptidase n=1 Tax=unclassified Sphingomonas TaxID=196159 RepID=UPI000926E073|nr:MULTISPECIES: amidohydrolase family protein [unclassified Sphingomonas]MBN8849407.1 amidohydrolase family protein [Sphingomonas sp.]OJV28854.1 MAG: Xaa-Pro dipeptidase [Sphingomonas sp. 67-36]